MRGPGLPSSGAGGRGRELLVLGGLLLVLLVPNYAILQKERLLADGTLVLLELAPVDPRSLIQGDYMRLDYAVARELSGRIPREGNIVVRLDDRGVASFVRRHDPNASLAAGELLLRYRVRDRLVRIATDAFFFQEGHASRYERARFGELRVSKSGESVLVALRDSAYRVLR